VACRLPIVRKLVVELILVGLDSDRTAVPVCPASVIVAVKDAPVIFDTAPVMCKSVGSYCKVKVPEVTFWPLLRATGMPKVAMLLDVLMVARLMDTPGVVEDNT
jgi:hypothetical protein